MTFIDYAIITRADGGFETVGCRLESFSEGIRYSSNRGTFSEVHATDGTVSISPDYLGTRVLYVYQGQDGAVASTSISLLMNAVRTLGVVRPDLEALASTFCMGNLQLSRLPVKGAVIAPPECKIVLSKGMVAFVSMRDPTIDAVSDQTLKARAVDEIRENILSQIGDHPLLLEMTGGLDSRVTLAAALNLGLKERIDFITRGKSDHPDRVCAERIAHAFDIDFVFSPYIEQTITDEQFQRNAASVAGVRWLDDVSFRMADRAVGFVGAGGGLGEIFRNYYCEVYYYKHGKRNDFFSQVVTEDLARQHFRKFAGKTNYLNPSVSVEDAYVSQLCSQPNRFGYSLFLQYNGFRNRIHYGCATASRNCFFHSFDPLYTVSGYELAKRKDAEWQLFGQFSFELIEELFPALNAFPLAEKEFAPRFVEAAKTRNFLSGMKPMQGMKERAPIPNLAKFGKAVKGDDIALDWINRVLTMGLGDEFFNLAKIDHVMSGDNESAKASMRKALASPLMFLSLIDRPNLSESTDSAAIQRIG